MERASCRKILPAIAGLAAVSANVAGARDPSTPVYVPPPLAVYGQLPSLDDPVLSPSGDRIAFIERQNGRRYLVVSSIATHEPLGVARLGTTKVRAVRWYDDTRLLIVYSTTSYPPWGLLGRRGEWDLLVTWNLKSKRMRSVDLRDESYRTMNVVAGALQVRRVKGRSELFVTGAYLDDSEGRTSPALFKVDLQGEETDLVAHSHTLGAQWVVDAEGRVAAALDYHMTGRREGRWTLRVLRAAHLRPVAGGNAGVDPPDVIGFSADDKALLVGFDSPRGWIWRPLRLGDDTWGAPLGAGQTFYDVIRDRLTGRVIGGVQNRLDPHLVFFDPGLQARWDTLLQAYAGERVELVSHSDDFSEFLIRVFGPRDGDEYVLINWRTVDSSPIGDVYRGLSTFAQVQRIAYRASDGLEIDGFLTLPPDRPARNLSLVVLPHGGPAATDDGDFDWWAQALASRGYAVLQVNFRGSDTTSTLLRAGFGQWGRKMQTDLSDGVHYLVGRGIIDANRVCIVGASYGGYAALAGVTLQSGIYRCAVSVAGIADLRQFLRWTDRGMMSNHNVVTRYWDRYLGATGLADPTLRALSPIDHVDAVNVPVLLIHGRDDTVVPYSQSEAMLKALRHAGKSAALISLPHEDHWLSHSATREKMLDAIVKFLERNDPSG